MKKITLLFCVISLFHNSASSQWARQLSGVTTPLLNVQFVNRFTGWATGSSSVILKTTDGGASWISQSINLGYPKSLYGLSMVDENTGYVAGWFETILKTTNGGTNWQIISNIPSNNGNSNNGVSFINSHTGWICSALGRVLKTTNGGNSWDTANVGNDGPLRDIQFLNQQTGWVCGDGGNLRKSTNGGVNWFGFQLLTTANLTGLDFINPDTGWVVSEQDNFIFRTTDGDDWDTIAQLPGGNLQYSYTIYFTSALTGYIGGTFTRLFKTVNGGFNWYRDSISNLGFINNFSFYNDSIGWAVGGGGLIIHTTNGGLIVPVTGNYEEAPQKYILYQNYPNPFNSQTKISFNLSQKSLAELKLYSIIGEELFIIAKGLYNSGSYEVSFDAGNLSSGVYFYTLKIDGLNINTKRMILIK